MFGKPQWFRPKTIGWGLVPVSWPGWVYTGAWTAAVAVPFLLLIWRHQPVEATTWMTLALSALVYDVWHIRRAMFAPPATAAGAPAKADDKVLYILDSQPGQQAATRNYNLQVRR